MATALRAPLTWLLTAYLLVSAVTLGVWEVRGVYSATGDEPHYLVIADALVVDRSTDVTGAYRREIDNPRWYPLGLAPPGSVLEPPAAHVVPTDSGLRSWHGLGVGALVAIPGGALGEIGARMVMVLVGAGAVALAWLLSRSLLATTNTRVAATVAVALAYPLFLAGTQIYPDVPAGVLLLGVLTWWMVPRARESPAWTALAASGAAVVPWLGSRFILPGAIALVAMAWACRRRSRFLAAVLGPGAVSAAGLLTYHLGAFGSILGPPTEGTLAFGREFWMLLPGLVMDQNQGFVWANPVLWIALPGVVVLWRRAQSAAIVWLLLVLSLWIPAAAHPGMYGLGSFNGRYAWPLAILAVLPAMVALAWLAGRSSRGFWLLVSAGVLFQGYLVALSVFIGGSAPGSAAGLDLYTKEPGTWLESYSAWWFPLQRLLPAWYDPSWAFTYPQNLVWLLIAVGCGALAVWTVLVGRASERVLAVIGVVGVLAVLGAAWAGEPGDRLVEQQDGVSVQAGRDEVGYPVIGPGNLMRWGTYVWWVDYRSSGGGVVGKWELVRVADDQVVAAGELAGSSGDSTRYEAPITFRALEPAEFVLRVGWYGEGDLTIEGTGVRYG